MGKKKGGKVQGRAKQKQKAQKASPGGKAPWMKAFARSFDDNEDDSNLTFRGFAQHSGQNTPRGPPLKLRHQAISFVSAGTNMPLRVEDKREEETDTLAALVDDAEVDEKLEVDEDGEDDGTLEIDEALAIDGTLGTDEDGGVDETLAIDEDGEVDDSGIQTNVVIDTEYDLTQGTQAMHIHEHTGISALDNAAHAEMEIEAIEAGKPPKLPETAPLSFVIDTVGDPALSRPQKGKAHIPIRASSPTPSDSSEEIILFHGRNKPTTLEDPISSSRKSSARQSPASAPTPQQPSRPTPAPTNAKREESHMTDDLLAALGVSLSELAPAPGKQKQQYVEATEGFTPAPDGAWWHKGAPRLDLGPSPAERQVLDDTAAAAPSSTKMAFAGPHEEKDAEQTIASLQAEWNNTKREKKRAKMEQAHENEKVQIQPRSQVARHAGMPASRRGKRGRKRGNKLLRDLEDDESDDEAAYIDYMENLKAQLDAEDASGDGAVSATARGPSLVIDGQQIADDQVLDADFDFTNARQIDAESSESEESDLIGQDTSELDDDGLNASDFDSSDLEEELEYNEQEQWEDEEDIRQRRIDAMDDEQIARLLAKQEELGIEGDEIILDDGAFMDEIEEGIGDIDEAKAGLDRLADMSFGRPKGKGKGSKRGGFSFPDASALADSIEQYGSNGFDIMDFDRPSLRPKPKGRKAKLPPGLDALSDDDLRDGILETWDNDRFKKRLKKAEREELRQQGLLGPASKNGKADLSQKYQQGMTTVQIHEELRIFLLDPGKTTRAFPSMAKDDRKALHEVANALNLKSKSVGSGKNRSPVLYKTPRTLAYSETTFARVARASSRGFLKNSAARPKQPKGASSRGPRGGRGPGPAMAAVGLRHGEVVGANAKAIGDESFGHRLMQKMGWQQGTALGKEGEGMLVPVQQVMRSGRSGLG